MASPKLRAILELVDGLDPAERDELRAWLDGVVDDPAEWAQAWNDELALRMEQIERGEVELVDGDEFLKKLLGEARS